MDDQGHLAFFNKRDPDVQKELSQARLEPDPLIAIERFSRLLGRTVLYASRATRYSETTGKPVAAKWVPIETWDGDISQSYLSRWLSEHYPDHEAVVIAGDDIVLQRELAFDEDGHHYCEGCWQMRRASRLLREMG